MSAFSRSRPDPAVLTAMVCAGVVSAQFIAGKATRDALYLTYFDVTSLPAMVVATAALSIVVITIIASRLRHVPPGTFVPAAFVVSAFFFVAEWGLTFSAPTLAAPIVYLHISGLGPVLGSGFWLIVTERFDPRSAKRHLARIAGIGTLSGLLGGMLAERVATIFDLTAVLPLLAGLNLLCAWQVRRLAVPASLGASLPIESSAELLPDSPRSGLRALAGVPYLRSLAVLVLFGTIAATLVDYVFKAQAVSTFGRGEGLLRFFTLYYGAVTLLVVVVQMTVSRVALERLGVAFTSSTPSLGLLAGSIVGLVVPGLGSAMVARGSESVFRGSLFRTGYELFFTPIPSLKNVLPNRSSMSGSNVSVMRLVAL